MTHRNHKWEAFGAAEIGDGPNDRHVRLPPRRACTVCGVTQILTDDLMEYPHVAQAIIDEPHKVWSVTR